MEPFAGAAGAAPGCDSAVRFDSFSFGVSGTGSTVIFSGIGQNPLKNSLTVLYTRPMERATEILARL
jgi:hypothetical protein